MADSGGKRLVERRKQAWKEGYEAFFAGAERVSPYALSDWGVGKYWLEGYDYAASQGHMPLDEVADKLIEAAKKGDSAYLEVGRLWNHAKATADFDSDSFMAMLAARGFDKSKPVLSKWGLVYEFWCERVGLDSDALAGKQTEKLYILAEYILNKAQARGDTLKQMALEWLDRVWGGERPMTDRELKDALYAEPGGDPNEVISIRRSISERIQAIAEAIAQYTGERKPSRTQIIERALANVPDDPVDLVMWWGNLHGEGGEEADAE